MLHPLLLHPDRTTLHASLARLWQHRDEPRDALPAEERRLLEAMEAHREFHPLWDRLAHLEGREPLVAGMNPVMHVLVHAVLEAQLEEDDPPDTRETLETLVRIGFTRHRALHVLGRAVMHEIYGVLHDLEPYDDARYRGRLGLLRLGARDPAALDALARRTGRNEPCPCGSGRKFKRCCSDFLPVDLGPGHWAFLLPGGSLYCTSEYAAGAPDDAPSVLLQNMSAVAEALGEHLDDPEGALLCYRQMLELAEVSDPSGGMEENVLQDLSLFALNHPEFAAEGLAAVERLLARVDGAEGASRKNRETRTLLELDRADLLTYLGRVEEADAIYRRALELAASGETDEELAEVIRSRWKDWQELGSARHGAGDDPRERKRFDEQAADR